MRVKRLPAVPVSVAVLVSVALLVPGMCFGAGEDEGTPELKPVLLVMDVQNIWMPKMAEEDRESAPGKINEAIALFREFGHPVVAIYHSSPERGPERGTEPFQFIDSVDVTDDDQMVVKAHASAFTQTELEQSLKDDDRNVVFLCGLSATGCVLATYFGAMDREFMVCMVEDALMSGNASHTDVIEDICYCMSLEEVREALEESP